MSYDRDRDRNRRPQPLAGPPEGGRSREYEQPFYPDPWDQTRPGPYRPQGGPPAESQADGYGSRGERGYQASTDARYQGSGERGHESGGERGYRWLRDDEERFAEGPPMPEMRTSGRQGRGGDGYGEENYHEEWAPQGHHQPGSPSDRSWFGPGPGPHAGRGPKGYQRSDERIRESVSEALARHPDLDASEIEVSVESAEVTLNGSAPNRWSKRLAEDLLQDMPGVKEVHNRLRIQEGNGH